MSAATKLRLVRLRDDGDSEAALVDWVWSGRPIEDALDLARQAGVDLTESEVADLMETVGETARTVAALIGLNLFAEVIDALKEQEEAGVSPEDFESPDLESGYGGEEPSELETVAFANTQTSYMAGRVDEDEESDDWYEYEAQAGACEICAPLDGTQAPQDDGIWADRLPPLHPNCVCVLKTIPAQKTKATEEDIPAGSRGRGGWGDPRARFDPDLSDKPEALLPLYHDKVRNLRRNE